MPPIPHAIKMRLSSLWPSYSTCQVGTRPPWVTTDRQTDRAPCFVISMALGVYRTEVGQYYLEGRSGLSDRPWAGPSAVPETAGFYASSHNPQVLTRSPSVTSGWGAGSKAHGRRGLQTCFPLQRLGEVVTAGKSWSQGTWGVREADDEARCCDPQDVLGSYYSRVCGWMAEAGGLS